jgi:hypothetical protein
MKNAAKPLQKLSVVVFGLALTSPYLSADQPKLPNLEKALFQQAPHILRYVQGKKYQNIGILKFRVKKGHGPVTDNAGTFNLTLAERLERALIMANKVPQPVGIVHNASAVAARIPGASHLQPEGRRKLFQERYPLAWGEEKVTPDAFLTGVAQISPDLQDMTVGILAFGRGGEKLEKIVQFQAAESASLLGETGDSFLLRGLSQLNPPKPTHKEAIDKAIKVKAQEEAFPLVDEEKPIDLEIRYDGKPVAIEIQNGQARVPEPQEGQEVTMVLKPKAQSKVTYGVVLKVNGVNTFSREFLPDFQCRKWVFEPGDSPTVIRGYQMKEGDQAEKFRVLSREESKQHEIYYGKDVGTITMTVFAQQQGGSKPDESKPKPRDFPEEEDLNALQWGTFPSKPAMNLAALQEQLRTNGNRLRGLIAEGETIESKVQWVKVKLDPIPVMTVTIIYYRPQSP